MTTANTDSRCARCGHNQPKAGTPFCCGCLAMQWQKEAEAYNALRFERNRYRECAHELRTTVKALEHRICTGRGTMLDCLPATEPALARSAWLDEEITGT